MLSAQICESFSPLLARKNVCEIYLKITCIQVHHVLGSGPWAEASPKTKHMSLHLPLNVSSICWRCKGFNYCSPRKSPGETLTGNGLLSTVANALCYRGHPARCADANSSHPTDYVLLNNLAQSSSQSEAPRQTSLKFMDMFASVSHFLKNIATF